MPRLRGALGLRCARLGVAASRAGGPGLPSGGQGRRVGRVAPRLGLATAGAAAARPFEPPDGDGRRTAAHRLRPGGRDVGHRARSAHGRTGGSTPHGRRCGPGPGIYLWRDPFGAHYLVDHTGTRRLGADTDRPPDTLSGVTEGPANPRIVAVVVTFNRLPLLQRLVARLAETEGLAEVLVVDNASTDGTGEWLAAQPAPVRTLTLPDNRGGAGGFHAGLQQAVDSGADLVWLMDDDGIPEPDCLKILLDQEDLDFWGPAVLAEQDQSRLCFPIRLPGRATVVHRMAEVELAARDGLIADVVIPFNGVLVTRELVERIGTPREEFFIWGDDVEYLWRARRAGARTGTVVAARFLHPATDDLGTPMAFGRTTYNHSPSDLKHYCMARNNLVNLRDYRGWPAALAFVAKTAWFYSFTRPDAGRLLMSARAMYAGLRGDFTGHRRFLR